MKKNDMESEEGKKMDNARWKANRIVTRATINIIIIAMDSSVFSLCFFSFCCNITKFKKPTEKQQALMACY